MNKLMISFGVLGLSTTLLSGCVEEQAQALVDSLTGNLGATALSTTGNYVSLDGTFDTGCYTDGTNGYQELLTIATDSVTGITTMAYSKKTWPGDALCNSVVGSSDMGGILLDIEDSAVKGWIDAAGAATSAPASAAGPLLSNTQPYTNLALTVGSGGADFGLGLGDLSTFSFVVDDSDSATVGLVLYRVIKRTGSPGSDAMAVAFDQLIVP